MACLDLKNARDIIEKHRDFFEKIASNGLFEDSIRKMVTRAYYVMLILKFIFLGGVWLFLTKVDSQYGVFFLLLIAMIQSKLILDRDFSSIGDNILEAAEKAGICKERKYCGVTSKEFGKDDECDSIKDNKAAS